MKTKLFRSIFLFILSFSFWNLCASEIVFKCNYSEIPVDGTGTYICENNGNLKYRMPSGEELDLLKNPDTLSSENIKINKKTACRSVQDLYSNRFYDFDKKGNCYYTGILTYFIFTNPESYIDYQTVKNVPVIYKFSPETLSITCKMLEENTFPFDFCASKDGKTVFVECLENYTEYPDSGIPAIYSISTDFVSEPVKLFSSQKIEKITELSISNICFDEFTNIFYYSVNETAENPEFCGLYEIKANFDGIYSRENLFLNNPDFVTPCKLFSNKEGLWAITKNETKTCSTLLQLKDSNGKTIKKQANYISKAQIYGNWFYTPQIIVEDDYILYLTNDKTKIIKIENNKSQNVSKYLPKKNNYKSEDLANINTIIQKEKKNEKDNLISKKTLLVSIYIIAVLIAVIVLLLFWIGHLTNKSNQLKKDKKFIFNIQETERGKISRDIHDSIIQDIRSIRLKTEVLKIEEESKETKKDVIRLATDCVVKLRNICYNLTPAELTTHEDGDDSRIELVSIIQSLVLQFIERTHVPCQLKIDENFSYPVLNKETSQNLFRIIQESLTNIEKHSYATSCQIWIRNKNITEKQGMLIYISDDGVGCDIKSVLKHRSKIHFGLQNIMDRAALIGATVEFESELGHGFEVSIQL